MLRQSHRLLQVSRITSALLLEIFSAEYVTSASTHASLIFCVSFHNQLKILSRLCGQTETNLSKLLGENIHADWKDVWYTTAKEADRYTSLWNMSWALRRDGPTTTSWQTGDGSYIVLESVYPPMNLLQSNSLLTAIGKRLQEASIVELHMWSCCCTVAAMTLIIFFPMFHNQFPTVTDSLNFHF